MSRLKRVWCTMFHWGSAVIEPWGIHHYFARCNKCGRQWDIWD